jgi:hypothetical protein
MAAAEVHRLWVAAMTGLAERFAADGDLLASCIELTMPTCPCPQSAGDDQMNSGETLQGRRTADVIYALI